MIKNMKLVEIIFMINTNVYVETGIPKKKFDKKLKKKDLLIDVNFVTMITVSLFCCCGKMFTHMNVLMCVKIQ